MIACKNAASDHNSCRQLTDRSGVNIILCYRN